MSKLINKTDLTRDIVVRFAIFAICITAPLYAFKIYFKQGYSDFDVYYQAVQRMRAGQWALIYNFEQDGATPYRYHPLFLIFFYPLGLLPFEWSRLSWYLIALVCYALGFRVLYQIIKKFRKDAGFILALAFLFVLRFILDSFTIGQVTCLMWLCFGLGIKAVLDFRPVSAANWLVVPASLKILPGIFYGLIFCRDRKFAIRFLKGSLFASIGATILTCVAFGGVSRAWQLNRDWFRVVAADSVYSDDAHYGSQSLKSTLLRAADLGWMPRPLAYSIWHISIVLGLMGVMWLWVARRPKNEFGIFCFFSLGIFAYLWLMPETFKYSQPFLAFPVAALFCANSTLLSRIALGFGLLVLSLAGFDVVGPDVFFWIQKKSIPFFASVLLGCALIQVIWKNSEPRRIS